jgi:hypothetical protein
MSQKKKNPSNQNTLKFTGSSRNPSNAQERDIGRRKTKLNHKQDLETREIREQLALLPQDQIKQGLVLFSKIEVLYPSSVDLNTAKLNLARSERHKLETGKLGLGLPSSYL